MSDKGSELDGSEGEATLKTTLKNKFASLRRKGSILGRKKERPAVTEFFAEQSSDEEEKTPMHELSFLEFLVEGPPAAIPEEDSSSDQNAKKIPVRQTKSLKRSMSTRMSKRKSQSAFFLSSPNIRVKAHAMYDTKSSESDFDDAEESGDLAKAIEPSKAEIDLKRSAPEPRDKANLLKPSKSQRALPSARSGSILSTSTPSRAPTIITRPELNSTDPDELKACTFDDLVDAVTSPAPSPDLVFQLLLTYRSLCSPVELLSAILDRYKNVRGPDAKIRRIRILNFLKTWVDKHWFDFSQTKRVLLDVMETFVRDLTTELDKVIDANAGDKEEAELLKRESLNSLGGLIKRITKNMENPPKSYVSEMKTIPPPPVVPPTIHLMPFHLLDLDPVEVARQITLLDEELWSQIKPWELLNQAWMGPHKAEEAPNVIKMIVRFNSGSRWVQQELLTEGNAETRMALLRFFMRTLQELIKLNNYNGALQIMSAFSSSAIYRLRSLFDQLTEETEEFEDVQEMLSRESNYKNLRNILRHCQPPVIPYLGMFQTDLIFIEEGQKDNTAEGLINFTKRRQVAEVIKQIQSYQLEPYCYFEVAPIQDYILNSPIFDDDQFYNFSLYIEPRAGSATTGFRPEELKETPMKDEWREKYAPREHESKSKRRALLRAFTTGSRTRTGSQLHLTQRKSEKAPRSSEDKSERSERGESGDADDDDSSTSTSTGPGAAGVVHVPLKTEPIEDASFTGLIRQLTSSRCDVDAVDDFLITYRTICTPLQLLHAIITRFNAPAEDSYGASSASVDSMPLSPTPKDDLHVRRSFCLIFLSMWITKYGYDFAINPTPLVRALEAWKQVVLKDDEFAHFRVEITTLASKASMLGTWSPPEPEDTPPLPLFKPSPNGISSILDIDPVEMARQLTIGDDEIFQQLRPWELLGQAWTKPNSMPSVALIDNHRLTPLEKREAPHVLAIFARAERLRGWPVAGILTARDGNARKRLLKYFISVAKALKELKNFYGFRAIMEGLASPNLTRLTKTYNSLSSKYLRTFEVLVALFSPDENHAKLRAEHDSVAPPFLPALSIYVNVLRTVEDDNSLFGPEAQEGTINFTMRRQEAAVLRNILRFQQTTYALTKVPEIQAFLSYQEILDKETATMLSELIQPPSGGRAVAGKPVQLTSREERIRAGDFESDKEWWNMLPVVFPDAYPFTVADDEDNFVVVESFALRTIQGATLVKLVEHLTLPLYSSASSLRALFTSYRHFATPSELLKLFIWRFKLPELNLPGREPPRERELQRMYHSLVCLPVRKRVLEALQTWLEGFFFDFEDAALLSELKEFITSTLLSEPEAILLQKLIEGKGRGKQERLDAPPAILGELPNKAPAQCSALDFDADEIARQITLADHAFFDKISMLEVVYGNYKLTAKSPHLHTFLNRRENLATLVQSDIQLQRSEANKAAALKKWCFVLHALQKLNNWNGQAALVLALSLFLGDDYAEWWQSIPFELRKSVSDLSLLFYAPTQANALKAVFYPALDTLPVVPFVPALIDELQYMEGELFTDACLKIVYQATATVKCINFERALAVSEVVHDLLLKGQTRPYNLATVPLIQQWLKLGMKKIDATAATQTPRTNTATPSLPRSGSRRKRQQGALIGVSSGSPQRNIVSFAQRASFGVARTPTKSTEEALDSVAESPSTSPKPGSPIASLASEDNFGGVEITKCAQERHQRVQVLIKD